MIIDGIVSQLKSNEIKEKYGQVKLLVLSGYQYRPSVCLFFSLATLALLFTDDFQKAEKEVDEIIAKLLNLKNSMQSDKPLAEISANGKLSHEVSVYNNLIKQKTKENGGYPPTWFQTGWLFAECYLYFKLHEIFYLR